MSHLLLLHLFGCILYVLLSVCSTGEEFICLSIHLCILGQRCLFCLCHGLMSWNNCYWKSVQKTWAKIWNKKKREQDVKFCLLTKKNVYLYIYSYITLHFIAYICILFHLSLSTSIETCFFLFTQVQIYSPWIYSHMKNVYSSQ